MNSLISCHLSDALKSMHAASVGLKEHGDDILRVRQAQEKIMKASLLQKQAEELIAQADSLLKGVALLKSIGDTRLPSKQLTYSVDVLELPTRARNTLRDAKITTLGELVSRNHNQLRMLSGFGAHTVKIIEEALAIHGLRVGMKFDT